MNFAQNLYTVWTLNYCSVIELTMGFGGGWLNEGLYVCTAGVGCVCVLGGGGPSPNSAIKDMYWKI